jgi:hypothetical protein
MSGVLNLLLAGAASAIKDAYYNLTTLLLNTSSTNGAQNNTFLDSSTNNFTITRNGNTTQGTFTPFSQTGWSNYFDGSGDYLSVPASSSWLFNGDASIEAWVYRNADTDGIIFATGGASSSDQLAIFASSEGLWWGQTSSTSARPNINEWAHILVTRSGSTIRRFINGVLVSTGTNGSAIGASGSVAYIGSRAGSSLYFNGHISNLRVINGSIPTTYQTSSTTISAQIFTPPTASLTATSQGATSADVKLLTCQSNRFIDNSSSAVTISRFGDTSVQAFSPFAPTAAYDAAVVGGSGYFDGTSDYLSLSSTSLNLGANDFTIETWVYATTTARDFVIGSLRNADGAGSWVIMFNDSQPIRFFCRYNGGTVLDYQVGSGTFPINTWTHLAITRSGANLRVFQNGTQVGTTNTTLSTFSIDNASTNYYVASSTDPGEFYTGYLSGTRLLVGTALYTTTFTPPTAPPTAVTNTTLLLNYTNSGIFDSTAKNVLETVGNAQVSTTQAKWGTTSMSFDGNGDYLSIPNTSLLQLGGSDWTIECWAYISSTTGDQRPISQNNSNYEFAFFMSSGGAMSAASYQSGGSTNFNISMGTLSAGQWYHLAASRSGSTVRAFVNGTLQNSATYSGTIDARTGGWRLGASYVPGDYFNGYLDDVRITLGYARYTANFTAPTAAFPLQ